MKENAHTHTHTQYKTRQNTDKMYEKQTSICLQTVFEEVGLNVC